MSRVVPALAILVAGAPASAAQDASRTGSIATRAPIDPADDIAFRAMAIPDTVWVGQQATYQVGVFLSDEIRSRLRRNPVFVPPELRSMLAYDLASLNSVPRFAGARRYEVHVFQRALFPLTAGRHDIPPARLEYALPLSNSFFAREESHSARTQSLVVVAKDPPVRGRPPDFKGAVGRLSVQARVDSRPQRTGDPFTYTAVVVGTGNVSLLPRPDLSVPWADVVPGAVRVQMDSTTTLVRGRKEFDWILTPVKPGRQAFAPIRYPYFNPYTEQYEVAFSRPESVSVSGTAVIAERAATDSQAVLPIRRLYAGEVPPPISDSPLFWILIAAAPVPFLLTFVGRRTRTARTTPPESQLREAMRASAADAALVRRVFARGLAERVHLAAPEMADRDRLRRALRRAGVSADTAQAASELLSRLDESVFGGGDRDQRPDADRAIELLRAVDDQARSRAALAARRVRRGASGLGLVLCAAVTARAAQDVVATTVFSNGIAAFDAREFGVARQAFHQLTQARPRAADGWYNFGIAAWQLHDTAAAVVGWQRAMRLDPTATDARAMLRLGPGTPRLWHAVPPFTVTMLASAGAALWIGGCLLLAWSRIRGRRALARAGVLCAGAAGLVFVAGVRQREVLDGRHAGVVLSAARLRAMPVLSADAGIEAQPGEVARLLGHQGAWSRVELTDGRRGWMEAQRIQSLAHDEPSLSIVR